MLLENVLCFPDVSSIFKLTNFAAIVTNCNEKLYISKGCLDYLLGEGLTVP